MRRSRRLWLNHPLLFALLVLALVPMVVAAADHTPKGRRSSPAPDGVCHPVKGRGYMVTREDGLKIPIGTLSPLIEGDSLVVETGTITFVDFRTGQSPVYGAGTRLMIPPVKRPERPPWWKRFEDYLVRSLSKPELERVGGSVRRGSPAFWPDSARFAPDVPVVFEWSGVGTPPAVLRICASGDTTECSLSPVVPHQGVLAWPQLVPIPTGAVAWDLLDAKRESLGGGCFLILTAEAAETERQRFHRAATEMLGAEQESLMAAVLAEADRTCLW